MLSVGFHSIHAFYKTGSDDDSENDSYKDIESESDGDSDSEKPTVSQPKKSTLNLKVLYVCYFAVFLNLSLWHLIMHTVCSERNCVDFTLN